MTAGTPSINLDEKILEKYKKMEMVYINDQEFYALYKLVSMIERSKHKDDFVFQMEYILPAQGVRSEYYRTISFALHCLKEYCTIFKITIDRIYLPEDKISKGFYGGPLKELQEQLSRRPNVAGVIAERELVDALVKGTATSTELFKITLPIGRILEVLDYAIFQIKKPSKKQLQNIQGFFWNYIEKFGNNQLHIANNHEIYFHSLSQLATFSKLLRTHAEQHAPETVINLSEMFEDNSHLPPGPLKNYSRFMPIHTLALAEKLGWIEVIQLNAGALDWVESMDMYDTEKNESMALNGYRVKLKVLDKFMEFTDPKKIDEQPKMPTSPDRWWKVGSKPSYDAKSHTIKLDDRAYELPPRALNQQIACEAVFPPKKEVGEYLYQYEVENILYKKKGSDVSPRAIYDAAEEMNNGLEKAGMPRLFEVQESPCRIRINKELFK